MVLILIFDLVVCRIIFLDGENLPAVSAHVLDETTREDQVNIFIDLGVILVKLLNILLDDIFIDKVNNIWEHASQFLADLVQVP